MFTSQLGANKQLHTQQYYSCSLCINHQSILRSTTSSTTMTKEGDMQTPPPCCTELSKQDPTERNVHMASICGQAIQSSNESTPHSLIHRHVSWQTSLLSWHQWYHGQIETTHKLATSSGTHLQQQQCKHHGEPTTVGSPITSCSTKCRPQIDNPA